MPRWVLSVLIGFSILLLILIGMMYFYTDTETDSSVDMFDDDSTLPTYSRVTPSVSSIIVPNITTKDEQKLSDEVLEDFSEFRKTGEISPRLFGVLEQIQIPDIFSMLPTTQSLYDSTLCIACRSVVDALLKYYHSGKSKQELRDLVYTMCTRLKISTDEVCAGLIDLNVDVLVYIINNTEDLTSSRMCAIILQSSGCTTDDPILEWTVDVDLGTKPAPISYEISDAQSLNIIQITDIHHDPTYTPNGNAVCGEPMCCRSKQGDPNSPADAAGYWGDYRSCDISWHTVENALQYIQQNHQTIDYIYMTGDLVDHAVWDTSIPKNTDVIKKVLVELKSVFGDIPIFPVLGNHEPSPLNVYTPVTITDETLSVSWLYELIAEQWGVWLPAETKETILKGGYYTALAKPGFRIVALNNNVCYTFNWWLMHDPRDQDGQLKWLAETLLQAEKDGEIVHILGHVPSGDTSCLNTWSREFHKIIDRFENIVTAQFYGHTHNDQYQIFYALDEPTRANNIGYNGGSLTTFTSLNSNYKVYPTDGGNYNILDSETWIFNLTEANAEGQNGTPGWTKLYSFKDAYGVKDMSPPEIDKMTHQMAVNQDLINKYYRYFVKDGDPSLAEGCDAACKRGKLCEIVRADANDSTQCNIITKEFDAGSSG